MILVQLDQILRLPALAVDVLVKTLLAALEVGDDVADVDLLFVAAAQASHPPLISPDGMASSGPHASFRRAPMSE